MTIRLVRLALLLLFLQYLRLAELLKKRETIQLYLLLKMNAMTPLVHNVIDVLSTLAAQLSFQSYASESDYRQAVKKAFINYSPDIINKTLKATFPLHEYQRGGERTIYDFQLLNGQTQVLFNG